MGELACKGRSIMVGGLGEGPFQQQKLTFLILKPLSPLGSPKRSGLLLDGLTLSLQNAMLRRTHSHIDNCISFFFF